MFYKLLFSCSCLTVRSGFELIVILINIFNQNSDSSPDGTGTGWSLYQCRGGVEGLTVKPPATVKLVVQERWRAEVCCGLTEKVASLCGDGSQGVVVFQKS